MPSTLAKTCVVEPPTGTAPLPTNVLADTMLAPVILPPAPDTTILVAAVIVLPDTLPVVTILVTIVPDANKLVTLASP